MLLGLGGIQRIKLEKCSNLDHFVYLPWQVICFGCSLMILNYIKSTPLFYLTDFYAYSLHDLSMSFFFFWFSVTTCSYIVLQLFHLSPQDPVFLIVFSSSNRSSVWWYSSLYDLLNNFGLCLSVYLCCPVKHKKDIYFALVVIGQKMAMKEVCKHSRSNCRILWYTWHFACDNGSTAGWSHKFEDDGE